MSRYKNVASFQLQSFKKKSYHIKNNCYSESRLAQGWGMRETGMYANEFKVSFLGDEDAVKLDYGDVCTAM